MSEQKLTPNDKLASEVVVALFEAGLVSEEGKDGLLEKLKTTGLTSKEWELQFASEGGEDE